MKKNATVLLLFVTASAAVAAPDAYRDAVLADEPLLYYRLGEISGSADNLGSLGETFDGTYNGAITRGIPTPGGDGGVHFNSVDDFIESTAAAPASLTGNPSFTAEAIVRIPTGAFATGWPPFLHWGSPGTGNSVYFSLQRNNADIVYAGFYNAGLRTTGILCRDKWFHIVWVRDSAGGTNDSETGSVLYINGQSVDLTRDLTLNPGIDSTLTVASTTFTIDRATDFSRWASIDMDEVALYQDLLSPAEVQAHWLAFAASIGDSDNDGIVNALDNCTLVENVGQLDTDGDDFGNSCDPDLNNDLAVNFLDLNMMKIAFFSNPASPSWNPDADFNGDNFVNFVDLLTMQQLFFGSPGPSGLVNFCGFLP